MNNQRGSAVIEMATWLPFIVMIMVGMVELAKMAMREQAHRDHAERIVTRDIATWANEAAPRDRPCLEKIQPPSREVTFVVDPICDD